MKILFLDIDGVLNSRHYDLERTATDGNIDESRLPLLKKIIEQTGAKIVLSSSWRKHWNESDALCDEIGKELNTVFGRYGLKIHGKTADGGIAASRPEEIRAYLSSLDTQPTSFAILDDVSFGWGELGSFTVVTNHYIGRGLEMRHVDAAIDILNKKGCKQ